MRVKPSRKFFAGIFSSSTAGRWGPARTGCRPQGEGRGNRPGAGPADRERIGGPARRDRVRQEGRKNPAHFSRRFPWAFPWGAPWESAHNGRPADKRQAPEKSTGGRQAVKPPEAGDGGPARRPASSRERWTGTPRRELCRATATACRMAAPEGFTRTVASLYPVYLRPPYSPPKAHARGKRQSCKKTQPHSLQAHSTARASSQQAQPTAHRAQGQQAADHSHTAPPTASSTTATATQPQPTATSQRQTGAATPYRPRPIPPKRAQARIKTRPRPRPRRYSRAPVEECGCGGAKFF